ncbi:MAG: HAMP domain-containing histidine kinase [Bacteroidales bacterium]|nr:HAMP domain-containing histidine kinase [Bacteroidales bacterium]
MNKRLIWALAAAISVCTLALIYVQLNWIFSIRKAEKVNFEQNIRFALDNAVADIDEAVKWNPSIQEQLLSGIIIHSYDLPIQERISIEEINDFLQKECQRHHLKNISYEFAVTNNASGEIIFSTKGFKDVDPMQAHIVALFPRDPDYVTQYSLLFYEYAGSIIRTSIWLLIGASILLTLIIIALFTSNLLIIFKQKQLTEIKNDFVNNITHELKTPITTISLAAQILNDPHTSIKEEKWPYLHQTILFETKRLQFLVEKVLQIAIFERKKFKLKYQEVDIVDLLSKITGFFTLQLENNNIKIITDFKEKGTKVWADETHLTNVFTNLVDNAIKYRKEQDAWIKITTTNHTNKVIITVEDNGIGIHKKNQKKIFTKFFREPTGNIHTVKGFGLGLNYVKQMIETLRGSIQIESTPEIGTQFFVTLPIMKETNKEES